MSSKQKNGCDVLKKIYILLLLVLIFSFPVNAKITQTFTLENNTGLNFMNGYYKIEVVEISKPGYPQLYAKINLSTAGLTSSIFLRQNEAADINNEPFNLIDLNLSSIFQETAWIAVEYPKEWSNPVKYAIDKPAVENKIPKIELKKSADKTTLKKGDVVEFKIILENTGNGSATNITLEDRLPPGFASAPGSRFPPVVPEEIKAGGTTELLYAFKAVDPGTYEIEPTIVKYGSSTARSNSLSITIIEEEKERSNLSTAITLDKNNILTGEIVKVTVKITNNGNVSAESILVDGTIPEGMEVTEGDLRQLFKKIESGDFKEYSASLEGVKPGNYTIILKTSSSDDLTGYSSNSDAINVKQDQKNYLYIAIPAIIIIVGAALFIIRRHREYSF